MQAQISARQRFAQIILYAKPFFGCKLHAGQEVSYGEAADVIEILAIAASESAPGGECTHACLQTLDFTPLDAEANENKYYAAGIGLIVEIDLNTGDRVELIEFSQAAMP